MKPRKHRRPPQVVRLPETPTSLLAEPEFRRWRYPGPKNLKRRVYEAVKRLARKPDGEGKSWAARVGR